MQRQAMYFVRWLTPFLPPLSVLAAETAHVAIRRLSVAILVLAESPPSIPPKGGEVSRFSPLWGELEGGNQLKSRIANLAASTSTRNLTLWPVVGVVLLLALPSTYVAVNANAIFAQTDTRTEALRWIQQHIPPGSTIAAEVLSPPWGPPLAMPGLAVNPYKFAPVPEGGVAEVSLRQLRDWQVQYVVTSSFYYARPLLAKSHQAVLEANMQALDEAAELLIEFQPYQEGDDGFFYHDQVYGPINDTFSRKQPGPVIKIYRLQ